MTKKIILSLSIIFSLLFISCTNKEELTVKNSTDAFQELEKSIQKLNSEQEIELSIQRSYGDLQELYDLIDVNGLIETTPAEPISNYDNEAPTCQRLDQEAFNMARDYGLSISSAGRIAAHASALCEAEKLEAESRDKNKNNYMVGNNGYPIFNPYRVDPFNPVFDITVDYSLANWEVGIEHNEVIIETLNNYPRIIFDDDTYFIAEKLIESTINLNYTIDIDNYTIDDYVQEIMPDLLLPNNLSTTNYLISKYNLGNEYRIVKLYENVASKLAGAPAIDYAKEFASIVQGSGVSNYAKEYIIGAISIYINSQMMWNTELPNPQQTNMFIVYDDYTGIWNYYTTREMVIAMMQSNSQQFLWGIPKFNANGEIIAIIFYENYYDYIPFSNQLFDTMISSESTYTFNNQVLLSTGAIISAGEYHIYENVFNEYGMPDTYVMYINQ